MKLQMKDAGAWRNVVNFEADRRDEVMTAAVPLLRALHLKTVMRVVDGETPLFVCSSPDFMWRAA